MKTMEELMAKRLERLEKLNQFRQKKHKMSKQYYLDVKTIYDSGIAGINEELESWDNLMGRIKHLNTLLPEESKEKLGYDQLEEKYMATKQSLETELQEYEELKSMTIESVKSTQQMLLELDPADRFILQVSQESCVDLDILEVVVE